MKYRFYNSIHVLRHGDGRKYPFELLRDVYLVRHSWQRIAIPGRQGGTWPRPGFETDFASIPGRRTLKRILEPQNLVPCCVVDESIKWAVWVYDDVGGGPVLSGYFIDKVAYAALLHDWLYSTRLVPCEHANEFFFEVLRASGVWSSWVMFKAVDLFGWAFYESNPLYEVREDRELGQSAMDRFLAWLPDADLQAALPYLTVPAG